jgi:hypothetical protein
MRTTLLIALLALLPALAQAAAITYSRTDFPSGRPPERIMAAKSGDVDNYEEIFSSGNALFAFGQLLSYEDTTNSVARVEGQFSYKVCTADCQVKNAPGFVHTVTCATAAGAAVAAAGAITIRDALTETTPIAATIGIPATATPPFNLTLDAVMTTGIYFAYDGTLTAGSVSCTVSYR